MSDPTQPPEKSGSGNPADADARSGDTGVPPAAPAAPSYPSYPPPAATAYQPPAYDQPPAYGQTAYGQNQYGQQNAQDKYNVLAIVSLVSAFFFSLVAVITGHIAMSQIKKTGEKGYGLALWGLILGYLGLVIGILIIILVIAIIVSGAATSTNFNT